MELNHRFLGVNQASLPLDHGTVLSVDSRRVALRSPACDAGIFLLDDEPILLSGSRGTRTHNRFHAPAVFKTVSSSGRMTSVTQAAGVGIEPTASWFRARRHYQQQLSRIVC